MASKAAAALVSSLFVLAFFSSSHVQARESKFFSKVTRNASPTTEVPSSGYPEAPAYAPAPAPAPESGIDDGYGLFGRGSEEFSTTTTAGSENQVSEEELMNESFKEIEEGGSNGYSNSYNQNNVYTGEKEGMSDTRFLENGKYAYKAPGKSQNYGQYSPASNNNGYTNEYYQTNEYTPVVADARYSENGYNYKDTYNANEYSTTTTTNNNNNNKNGYQVEQQGMSDTRFLENGKYFHSLENEKKENNYRDGYTTEEKESNSHEVYYPNTENSGEFYNQYQGQQQEYQQEFQEAPEEYVP